MGLGITAVSNAHALFFFLLFMWLNDVHTHLIVGSIKKSLVVGFQQK
jgi:hypothetical protein